MFATAAAKAKAEREEHDRIMAPYVARRAFAERVSRVEELFRRRPDLQDEWREHLIDRFENDGAGGPFDLIRGKVTGFRGPCSDALVDRASNDQFSITGGDVADNRYSGQVNGRAFDFSVHGHEFWVEESLDDDRMRVLARLLNANVGFWTLASMDKPVTVIRPRAEFHGEKNREARQSAKLAFGEPYLS